MQKPRPRGRPKVNKPGASVKLKDVPKEDLKRFRRACRNHKPRITMRAALIHFIQEFGKEPGK